MLNQTDNKFRDRKLALLLYPEDITHANAIQKIKESYDYAMILHDKDMDENGELKKPHFHVILRFNNQQWNTAICKDLGIELNYAQKVKNLDNALLYLVHYNDPEKYQYNVEDVKGNLKQRIKEKMNVNEKSEGEKIMHLVEYIENSGYLTFMEFSKYCASNGYWSEYRRSASLFIKLIEEHNKKVSWNNDRDC